MNMRELRTKEETLTSFYRISGAEIDNSDQNFGLWESYSRECVCFSTYNVYIHKENFVSLET